MLDGFEHRTVEIKAYHKQKKSMFKPLQGAYDGAVEGGKAGAKAGGILAAAIGVVGGISMIFAPFAAPLILPTLTAMGGAIGGGTAVVGGVGLAAGYVKAKVENIDIWIEETKKDRYYAPKGHEIRKDPTFDTYGQGRVRILNRDKHSFEFEITAFQGEFTVVFTSYERWMHKAASGEY